MDIGFTGTRHGMSDAQRAELEVWLHINDPLHDAWFHHGDCVGADEQAALMAENLWYSVVSHPGPNRGGRAFYPSKDVRKPLPYLKRNHNIVDECSLLIAAPRNASEEVLRSGTWATIRYAWAQKKPVHILRRS